MNAKLRYVCAADTKRLRDPVEATETPFSRGLSKTRSPSDARCANATIFPSCLRRQRKRLPTHDWICGKASRSGATTKTIGRGARAVMTIAKTRSNASVWARGVSDSLPGSTANESPSCSLRTGTKMSVSSCVYRAQRLVRVNCWGSAQKKGVLHAENKKLTFPACPSTRGLEA